MKTVTERLKEAVNKSNHNGKIKVLSHRVDFTDGTYWEMGNLVKILGVNYLYVRVLNLTKNETAKVIHDAIIW